MNQPHIKVEEVADWCLISGNPDRVPVIASYLSDSELIANHRGLVAYRGYTPDTQTEVTLLTTGMGGPTTAIVLEEAYRAGGRKFIRIGSCGSLIADHDVGTIYIPTAAIRSEGVSSQLIPVEVPAIADTELQQSLVNSANTLNIEYQQGLVATSDIYYADDNKQFFEWTKYGALCVEMEVAVLFSYSRLKTDMVAAAILSSDGNLHQESNNIYNDKEKKISKSFDETVNNTIEITINSIDNFEHNS